MCLFFSTSQVACVGPVYYCAPHVSFLFSLTFFNFQIFSLFLLCLLEWAEKLTEMGKGKHHLGDFLPPDELEKFMETYSVSVPKDYKYKKIDCRCLNVFQENLLEKIFEFNQLDEHL